MKQQENNEIDTLLRGLASRERTASVESAGNASGAHLDADELNSYAEGALPLSTRARYTSHLADCDDCRKIVAQLSLAAGTVISETPIGQSATKFDWRKMLAALFAPAVLRYAMPALVLIAVGAIFFASRREQRDDNLANLTSRNAEVSPATQSGGETTKEQSEQTRRVAPADKNAAPSSTQAPGAAKAGEEKQKTADTKNSDSSATSNEKESPKNEVAAQAQPSYAPEPPPPPAIAKPATVSETKDSSQVASAADAVKPSAPRKREADKQTEKERDEASASGAAPEDAPAKGRDDDRKKAKSLSGARGAVYGVAEQPETRAVGGRHFQRRNGIWVDTGFNSSLSITMVTRGSEEYRGLVADEPAIDTIAKQLSGEVLLVWKGRAYRIR